MTSILKYNKSKYKNINYFKGWVKVNEEITENLMFILYFKKKLPSRLNYAAILYWFIN